MNKRGFRRTKPVTGAMNLLLPVLLDSKILPQLEMLEMRGHLTNKGVEQLWNHRDKLAHLSLRINPRRQAGRTVRVMLADLGQKDVA